MKSKMLWFYIGIFSVLFSFFYINEGQSKSALSSVLSKKLSSIQILKMDKINLSEIVSALDDEDDNLVDEAVDDLEDELQEVCEEADETNENDCEDCVEDAVSEAKDDMRECLDDTHDNDLADAKTCCTSNGCTASSSSGGWFCTCIGTSTTATSTKILAVTECIDDNQQDEERDCERDIGDIDGDECVR